MVGVTYFPITSMGSLIYPALNAPLAQALITFDSLKKRKLKLNIKFET
jgi:hypothetical protein